MAKEKEGLSLNIKVHGLDRMVGVLNSISDVAGAYRGAVYQRPYAGKGPATTGELMHHLKSWEGHTREEDGITISDRDLLSMDDNEQKKIAEAFRVTLFNEFRKARARRRRAAGMIARGKTKLPTGKERAIPRVQASVISTKAFRAAGRKVLEIMSNRIIRNQSAGGNEATKVSDIYGRYRSKKYSVGISEVFKRTGQLLSNLSPDAGSIAAIKMIK
jgi:hypothetical protein